MTEFLYHALGICGEHWHPNLINVTAIVMIASIVARIIYKRHAK
jgi:hypothetical protein